MLWNSILVPAGCTTEISYKGQQFLTTLFERFDKDRDGALSPAEVDDLFSTCPAPLWGPDVHRTVSTNSKVLCFIPISLHDNTSLVVLIFLKSDIVLTVYITFYLWYLKNEAISIEIIFFSKSNKYHGTVFFLEKLVVTHTVKKFPGSYGRWKFLTLFIRSYHSVCTNIVMYYAEAWGMRYSWQYPLSFDVLKWSPIKMLHNFLCCESGSRKVAGRSLLVEGSFWKKGASEVRDGPMLGQCVWVGGYLLGERGLKAP